jgi:hypothetical protein
MEMASDRYLAVLSFKFWVLSFEFWVQIGSRAAVREMGSASVRQSDLRFEI